MLPQPVSASTANIVPKALKQGAWFIALAGFSSRNIVDIFLKFIALSIDMELSPGMFFILCFPEVAVFLREDAFRPQPGAVGY